MSRQRVDLALPLQHRDKLLADHHDLLALDWRHLAVLLDAPEVGEKYLAEARLEVREAELLALREDLGDGDR